MSAEVVPVPGPRGADPVLLARAVLVAIQALAADADAAFAPVWAWEVRTDMIGALDRAGELIGLYRARLLAAHKEDGRWARTGDRSFESFRGRTARTGLGAARAEMELAEGLAQLPQAAQAVEDGQVGLAHAEVLTRLHAHATRPVRDALAGGGTSELLAMAASTDAPTFAKRAAAWAAAHDVDAAEASFERVRARRYLRLIERDGGTKLDGFVDPIVGASVRTAMEAVTPVPAADDHRSSEQRAADALALVAARVLDQGADKIGAQIRPHISLVIPAETWAATRESPAETDSSGHSGDVDGARAGEDSDDGARGAAEVADGAGVSGPGAGRLLVLPELDDGTVVPLSELERIACDCELTRVVMDADGVPLDVGHTERTYSRALRRAILVRDGCCQWPGCTMRSSWCEVHHRRWFSHGGATSSENALTLCVFHHHEVHRRKIRITPAPRGHTFARADGTAIGTNTRDTGILRMLVPRREPTRGLGEGSALDRVDAAVDAAVGAPAVPGEGSAVDRVDAAPTESPGAGSGPHSPPALSRRAHRHGEGSRAAPAETGGLF